MEENEVNQLVEEMDRVAKKFSKLKPHTLVVLDNAARPLALPMKKILKDAFGQRVEVLFISPTFIKTFHEIYIKGGFRYSPEMWGGVRENLLRELPGFMDAVNGKRVAILDEQKKSGATLEAMESIVRHFGASAVTAEALSNFPKKPEYSWRRDKVRFALKAENKRLQFLSRRVKDRRAIGVRRELLRKVTPRVINKLRK
ncbi:MAG: hypothetical protein HOE11_04555 [Candidatus Diapherotrites archaeon]|nr:hypothetical protein [Candidatus Diapherotrites archaeon]MBT4596820.1 hypothetical protein [Candidatus Diapherotrites archaeon]